nr:HSD3B [Sinohyriopsis cumingii]
MATDVVLVTGGAGFLGQHVVRLLQTHTDHVMEIRVLDTVPYKNELDHEDNKPVISIVGSVSDVITVETACKGVDSVVHVAGLVDFSLFPDMKKLESVNVKGTQNVIEACIKQNVKRLIHCSSVDVVMAPGMEVFGGTEKSMPKPEHFFFDGYASTKQKAEEMVLKANGRILNDGGKLRTLSLRPVAMYGELDKFCVTFNLHAAHKLGGVMYQLDPGKAVQQFMYAGNAAWFFICAEKTLRGDNSAASGHAYFLGDETPLNNYFDFLKPYLAIHNFKLSTFRIPLWLVLYLLYLIWFFLWVISPVKQFNLPLGLASVIYIGKTRYYSYDKAKTLLSYSPLFSPEEAWKKGYKFYSSLKFPK